MKWLNRLSAVLLGLISIGVFRQFFSKYEILVFDKKDIEEARQEQKDNPDPMDLRGTPTHVCVCGSNQFFVRATFHNFELAQYFLDMECVSCGSLLTAPTPVDRKTE